VRRALALFNGYTVFESNFVRTCGQCRRRIGKWKRSVRYGHDYVRVNGQWDVCVLCHGRNRRRAKAVRP